jgi:hypothetical protein
MKYGICNQNNIVITIVPINTTVTTTLDYTRQYLLQDFFLHFLTAELTIFHEYGPMTETCVNFFYTSHAPFIN